MLLALGLTLACGGDAGPTDTGTDTDGEPDEPSVAGTVGPAGGSVTTPDGTVTLEFPPDAVSDDVEITVADPANAPSSADLVEDTPADFGPDGTQFAKDVRIVFRYDRADLPDGMAESSLGVYKAVGDAWVESQEVWADTVAGTVAAEIQSFSTFGVLGNRVADVEGTWFVQVKDTETTCPPAEEDAFEVNIAQDGTTLELSGTDPDVTGLSIPGEISGNVVRFQGTVVHDNGEEETLDVQGTFSADVTRMNGTSDWSVKEPDGSTCSGKASWEATRS